MKIFIIVLTVLSLGLIAFNITQVDFSNPFSKDSTVALITIVACLCAVVLLQILRLSKKIEKKVKTGRHV